MLCLTQLTILASLTLINGNVDGDCPSELNDLVLDPPELVVRYGDPASVICRSLSNKTDIHWEESIEDALYKTTNTWQTNNLTYWEIQPICYLTLHDDNALCNRTLPLIIYKPPDQVSISIMNHTGPMTENRTYELLCDIHNVAPVHLLTVIWYKGPEQVSNKNFTDDSTKFPVNRSATLHIVPTRDDHEVQYRCEAQLNLGPEGPQPPPTVRSGIVNIIIDTYNCSDLVLNPPELVVRYGDPVSVSCRSLSNYTHLGWRVSLGNVSSPVNRTVTWKTDNLTDYEIQPVCYMIHDGVPCYKILPLIVYKLPDKVSMSILNQTGPMSQGKKYDLQCDVQMFAPVNVLAVFWYHGETLLKNRGFSDLPIKTPSNKSVALRITAIGNESVAPFSCEAKLKLGASGPQPSPIIKSNFLNVTVQYKPVLTCSNWSPMINSSLSSYPYNLTANPSPTIHWYRDRSWLSNDLRLSGNDSGLYTVVALNLMGRAFCNVQITVEYAPIFKCLSSYEARENDDFSDKCSVMASPGANVTWVKDGQKVNPLHILTRGDTGSYVITAVNKHGTEQHNLIVNVLYGPEIKLDNPKDTVDEGENVSLICTADGNPEPEVRWSFKNQTKVTGRTQTTLNITKAQYNDDGEYTCTATNGLKNDTRTVQLKVKWVCPIKLQPPKLVVEFGTTASAECSTTTTHYGLGWEASQGPIDMIEDVESLTWRVENLTHWDIKPICFINLADEQCNRELPLIIYKLPDQVSISTVNHTGPMIEHRQYVLQCDVYNVAPVYNVTVNWYKGKALVKSVDSGHLSSKTPQNISHTLRISTNKDDDGVQYRCEAKLSLGPDGPQPPPVMSSDPLNIDVLYKPVLTCSNWSPMINSSLNSHRYKLMGKPSPVITWYRDKSPVSGDVRLSRNDSGQYKLVASNLMGNTSCDVQITVEYAPIFKCLSSYEARENVSFSDKCSVMASPGAYVTWVKDGKKVNPLHILTRGDNGSYLITAVNKHGTEQHDLTVNVLYGPEIKLDQTVVTVQEGKDISQICTADGNPEPELRWTFQNHTKATGRRQTKLIISKAQSADAGEYMCTANNDLGSDTRTVSLSVYRSSVRTIIITFFLLLLLIVLIVYIIYKYIQRSRSGKYNIEGNGGVQMSLMNNST